MRILVTGETGRLGSVFAAQAMNRGHEVITAGRRWMTPLGMDSIPWPDIHAVAHFAAAGVIRENGRRWGECLDVNFHALIIFLEAIAKRGAHPIILIPRSALETEMNRRPELWTDAYAVTKRLGSMFAADFRDRYKGSVLLPVLEKCEGDGHTARVIDGLIELIEENRSP